MSKISVNYCDGADHPELIRLCTTCTEPTCDGLCERYCDMYRRIMGKPERKTVVSQADAADDNRRHNARRIYQAFGETHTLTEWARITGLTYQTIWCRIERGMQIEEALSIGNYRSHCKFTFAGVTRGVTEWCRECKIPRSTFYNRLNGGMTIGQALGLEA